MKLVTRIDWWNATQVSISWTNPCLFSSLIGKNFRKAKEANQQATGKVISLVRFVFGRKKFRIQTLLSIFQLWGLRDNLQTRRRPCYCHFLSTQSRSATTQHSSTCCKCNRWEDISVTSRTKLQLRSHTIAHIPHGAFHCTACYVFFASHDPFKCWIDTKRLQY